MPEAPPDRLLTALAAALQAAGSPWASAPLEPLKDKGLAHDHVRLVGTGVLARIPKQSQMQLAAQANLAYQCACFERAAASGHTPRLHAVLPPSAHLPRGALLVQEIEGRSARLPQDLPAIVQALAAVHALPLPAGAARAPLRDDADPLQALHDEIGAQATHLAAAGVAAPVHAAILEEQARLQRACAARPRPPRHLVAFDGHPGNFVVRADGGAVLVDLEKCRYSYPGLDLAHATLYTSTTWDVDSHAVLSLAEVQGAYAVWAQAVGDAAAQAARPWLVPLRRAMWLWSVTWCAKWRVLSGAAAGTRPDGEDWSAGRSDAALVAHVRDRVTHYLSPPVVAQMRAEFDALDASFAP